MTAADTTDWPDRVQCALAALAAEKRTADRQSIYEMVAARFASRFGGQARLREQDRFRWQNQVDRALESLVADGVAEETDATGGAGQWQLTVAGHDSAPAAWLWALDAPEIAFPAVRNGGRDRLLAGVLTPALREKLSQPPNPDSATHPIMIELNLGFRGQAMDRVRELWRLVKGSDEPLQVAGQYVAAELTTGQIEGLVAADSAAGDWSKRAIYCIWPDFPVHPQIDASSTTIKAVAAQHSFDSFGDGIVWAVVDSGVAKGHPHFQQHNTLKDESVADLHRDFTVPAGQQGEPLNDVTGHGTHVAAIIAGALDPTTPKDKVIAGQMRLNTSDPDGVLPIFQSRAVQPDPAKLAGMAPRATLVSLKVLGGGGPLDARTSRVMSALKYVQEVNEATGNLRIHGVNLSVGYEFAAAWFACGQSPLCVAVDKLVRSGVVVVVAAGNSGYVALKPQFTGDAAGGNFSAASTINDPGNAERAITVGSTHRASPHTYGVTYFSSRGPTGDGRRKPDLVAPGERITSAAAGANLDTVKQMPPGDGPDRPGAGGTDLTGIAAYIEESGTSMAAPHVSGAIAAFLSVQREYIGNPDEVKRIFLASAIDLGRERAFQGAGLVNLLGALQSV
jgi:subtilisin family serine protease